MFGALRLLLAALVALYHAGVQPRGWAIGPIAVVGFYAVSGFVMAALIERYYARLGKPTLEFYLDRAMRILPQFLLFIAIALLLVFPLGVTTTWFHRAGFDLGTLGLNLLIVPLNLYSIIPSLDNGHILLPPTWSLGAEVQFYLLAPFILRTRWGRGLVAVVSVGLFALAVFGALNTEQWAYRLLPGTLFAYLTGSLLHARIRGDRDAGRLAAGLYVTVAAIAMATLFTGQFDVFPVREVLVGYLLVIPAIYLLGERRPTHADTMLGNASYGTFLSHFLVIYVLMHAGYGYAHTYFFPAFVLAGGLGLGFLGWWLVERPVVAYRRRLRARLTGHPEGALPPQQRPEVGELVAGGDEQRHHAIAGGPVVVERGEREVDRVRRG
jgi:peptidoglycan/LPS O-acetylase OafA/YrhL